MRKLNFNRLIIFFSNRCNLKCSYCIVKKGNDVMLKEDFYRLVDFLRKDKRIKTIKFFGGEPLINFNLIKELVCIFNDKYDREIVTNGYYLTNSIFNFFKLNNFKITISIDFWYKQRIEILKKFGEYKDNIILNVTLMPSFIDRTLFFIKEMYSNGFYKFNILPIYYKIKRSENDLYRLKKLFEKLVLFKLKFSKLVYLGIGEGKEKLININDLFLSYDGNFYLSDMVENYYLYGGKIKDKLRIGDLKKGINNLDDINKKYKLLNDFLASIEDKGLANVVNYFTSFYNRIFKGKNIN